MIRFIKFELIYLIKLYCISCSFRSLGHGEYADNCQGYAEYLIECPIKHGNYSACIGNNIDIDTVKTITENCYGYNFQILYSFITIMTSTL